MPNIVPVKQYQGSGRGRKGREGTLLKSFTDGYYNETITGRTLGAVIKGIGHLMSPVEPRARKQDRLDKPRMKKQDRKGY